MADVGKGWWGDGRGKGGVEKEVMGGLWWCGGKEGYGGVGERRVMVIWRCDDDNRYHMIHKKYHLSVVSKNKAKKYNINV